MSPLFWLLLTALFAVPVYLVWEDRARKRLPEQPEAPALELVGCMARVVKVDGSLRVRVTESGGKEHVLPARFEDVEDAPEEGQEFLVIENPKKGRALVAVPADLPRLEDQCP